MEHYYFIIKDINKEGPFKLEDLKNMKLSKHTQIWRSDFEKWENILNVDELKDLVFIEPPKTEKELKIEESKGKFKEWIKGATLLYISVSLLLAMFSTMIAYSSYEKFQEKIAGKYSNSSSSVGSSSFSDSFSSVSTAELLDYNRYPMYERGVDLENIYGLQQGYLFRVYKPYFSTLYITREERNTTGGLFINLLISSILTNLFFFASISIIYYLKLKNLE
jgi:hypothetical protein